MFCRISQMQLLPVELKIQALWPSLCVSLKFHAVTMRPSSRAVEGELAVIERGLLALRSRTPAVARIVATICINGALWSSRAMELFSLCYSISFSVIRCVTRGYLRTANRVDYLGEILKE